MTSNAELFLFFRFDPFEKLPNGQGGEPTNNAGKVTGHYHVKYGSPNDTHNKAGRYHCNNGYKKPLPKYMAS
jgi:hypothetical protein